MCVQAGDFPNNSAASFSGQSCNRLAGPLFAGTGCRPRRSCRTLTRALVQRRRRPQLPERPAPVYQQEREFVLPTLISRGDRSEILQRRSCLCQWPSLEASYAFRISQIFRSIRLLLSGMVLGIDSRLRSWPTIQTLRPCWSQRTPSTLEVCGTLRSLSIGYSVLVNPETKS